MAVSNRSWRRSPLWRFNWLTAARPEERQLPRVDPFGPGDDAGETVAHKIDVLPDDPVGGPACHFEESAALRLDHQHVSVRQQLLHAADVRVERLGVAALVGPDD